MSDHILVPVLGESVTEATVAKWLKNEGDKVSVDEAIVELETDKVNVEVPAPSSGILDKISVKEGQTVNVGALLGTMSSSSVITTNLSVEEKEYSPPLKKLETVQNIEALNEKKYSTLPEKIETAQKIKVFQEKKIKETEEPLILTEIQEEKNISQTFP